MSQLSAEGLCLVQPRVSCVIHSARADTWKVVKDWQDHLFHQNIFFWQYIEEQDAHTRCVTWHRAPFAWLSQVDGIPVVAQLVVSGLLKVVEDLWGRRIPYLPGLELAEATVVPWLQTSKN